MTESISFIPSRVKNCAEGGHVAGARDIIDDSSGMTLDELVGNKEYAPTDFSGMGRVVLKKNMVDDANTLTQDMFYKDGDNDTRVPNTNTIFVIQYDFTLGEDITIPANCVLEFDGGSISGEHTIIGSSTNIVAGMVQIFGTAVILDGTWNVAEGYALWFGGNTSATINKAITSLKGCCININGNWTFDEQIVVPYNTSLRCDVGTMTVPASITSGTLMVFYCSRQNHYLGNFVIKLPTTYANSSCIEMYGCSTALQQLGIEGYDGVGEYSEPIAINLSTTENYFPMIVGAPSFNSIINNVTGLKIHAIETPSTAASIGSIASVLYDKKVYINTTFINTAVRLLNDAGCNGMFIYICSRWCQNGISLYQEGTESLKVHIGYQTESLYPGKIIGIDAERYKPMQMWYNATTYIIETADLVNGVTIDNNPNTTYIFPRNNGDAIRQNCFATKPLIADTRILERENKNTAGSGVPILYTSYIALEKIISGATDHNDAVGKLLTYLNNLAIFKPVVFNIYMGAMSNGANWTLINKLLYPDGDTPLITADTNYINLSINISIFNASNSLYRRFIMSFDIIDKNIRYEIGHVTSWNTSHEITSVTVEYKRVVPMNAGIAVSTSNRPILDARGRGFQVFDYTISKPIWYTGSEWVDATGATV